MNQSAEMLKDPMSTEMVVGTYFRFHWQALQYSLAQLRRNPLGSFLTALAMGISLALPTALEVFVNQVQKLSAGIQNSSQITLYLKQDLRAVEGRRLAQNLKQWPELSSVEFVTSEKAMKEFQHSTGLPEVVQILDENPFPPQIRIMPKITVTDREATNALVAKLKGLSQVEIADLDLRWLQELHSLTQLGWRSMVILAVIFGTGVLVISANSIRLTINNQKDNIAVSRLMGATNAYIRRPFLYTGFWFGLTSGLIAWICVVLGLGFLQAPLAQLGELFEQEISLFGAGLLALKVIPFACFLGWFGSRIGSAQILRELDFV